MKYEHIPIIVVAKIGFITNFENVYLKLILEMNESIDNKSPHIIPTGLTTKKDYNIMKSIMRTVI